MVFSDEMLLDIKEFCLLLCLPEVDRAPPRAKEERHVVCVFARVAAKEVILGFIRKKVTYSLHQNETKMCQKHSHQLMRVQMYVAYLGYGQDNIINGAEGTRNGRIFDLSYNTFDERDAFKNGLHPATTTYLKSLSERTPNLPATCCSPELLLRHS